VSEILPRACNTRHDRLAAELAFCAHLTRDACHVRRERVELIHHRADGVLELEDFSFDIDGDLARQVAARDGGGDLGDVAYLAGEIARHRVDVVGEVLPCTGDARHDRLTAELACSADLSRHTFSFGRQRPPLSDLRAYTSLFRSDFSSDIDGDLAGEVAARDRDRHLGDVAYLRRQIARHRVDVVGQVLPAATQIPYF